MKDHFDTDYLESYILDKLPEKDKIALEQLIEQDPILKSELQIQKEIIDAIRAQRRIQLKQRLSGIPVNTSSTDNFYRAVLLGTALVAGLFSIFWFTKGLDSQIAQEQLRQEEKASVQSPQTKSSQPSSTILTDVAELNQSEANSAQEISENNTDQVAQYQTESAPRTIRVNARRLTSPVNSTLKPVESLPLVPVKVELSVDKEESVQKQVENFQAISKLALNAPNNQPIKEEVKGIFDGPNEARLEDLAARNRLSYQYYNNQLFLYNNRSWGRELRMEIDGQEELFLYYESEYYHLNKNQVERTEPCPIKDQAMIKKLDALRIQLYGK